MFRHLLLLGFLLLPTFFSPSAALGEEKNLAGVSLSEEALSYDISFLWFERLAEGNLTFTAGDLPGTYRAVLHARTRGIAASLSGNRAQRYVSVMETVSDGKLRAISHEAHDIRGSSSNERKARTKRYLFDYARGEVLYQRVREGKLTDERTVPIDRSDPPTDMLTALYNFRNGLYGRPTLGKPITISAFSHKGNSDIIVELLAEEERSALPFPPHGEVCRITLDPEVFDTGGGSVFVWFNEAGEPACGLVENVKGLGDVRGTIR